MSHAVKIYDTCIGVAIAPGIGFGDYNEFFRISACLDIKTLIEGMDIIKTRL